MWSVTSQLQRCSWDPDVSLETQAPPPGPGAPLGSGTLHVTLSARMNACVRDRMGCLPELQPPAAGPLRPGRATSGAGGGWTPAPGACPL